MAAAMQPFTVCTALYCFVLVQHLPAYKISHNGMRKFFTGSQLYKTQTKRKLFMDDITLKSGPWFNKFEFLKQCPVNFGTPKPLQYTGQFKTETRVCSDTTSENESMEMALKDYDNHRNDHISYKTLQHGYKMFHIVGNRFLVFRTQQYQLPSKNLQKNCPPTSSNTIPPTVQ